VILVDSCVWIDLLKNKNTAPVFFLKEQLSRPDCGLGISHIIQFEVLRGISDNCERMSVQELLGGFAFFDFSNEGFEDLAKTYQHCRKNGFTLPKLGDWLIFKTIRDHHLTLLTSDRDFYQLQQIVAFDLAMNDPD
jgi:predicted nucleic acid-binding protein